MSDTQTLPSLHADAGGRYKLTQAAIDRLMTICGVDEIEDLAAKLGFSRQTFWRLRTGKYDISLFKARQLAAQAEMPIADVFEVAE